MRLSAVSYQALRNSILNSDVQNDEQTKKFQERLENIRLTIKKYSKKGEKLRSINPKEERQNLSNKKDSLFSKASVLNLQKDVNRMKLSSEIKS